MRKITENELNALVGGKKKKKDEEKKIYVKCMAHGVLYEGNSYIKGYAAWWGHFFSNMRCSSRYVTHNLL